MPDVVGYGTSVMDLSLLLFSQPVPDEACPVKEMSWQFGGAVGNGLCATRLLSGASCGMVGPYGGNTGKLIKQDFLWHGIDVSQMFECAGKKSRLTAVLSFEDISARSFCNVPNTMPPIEAENVDLSYLSGAKFIFVHRADAGSIKAARYACENGIKVMMDADIRTDTIEQILPFVDYCIASEKCFNALFPEGGIQENLKSLRKMLAPGALAMVTRGSKGLSAIDGEGYFTLPIFDIKVSDTAGCGDIFHGAFIAGLLRGMDNRACAKYASGASTIKATRIGCHAGIPTHDVLMRFLETGEIDYQKIDERVEHYSEIPVLALKD